MKPPLTVEDQCLRLSVRLQPKASREGVLGVSEEHLRVAVTAPPVDGAANAALIRFLAKELKVAKGRVEIVSGHSAREKGVTVHGATRERIHQFCAKWGLTAP